MNADHPARDTRGKRGFPLDNPYDAGAAPAHRHPDPRRLLFTAGALSVGVASGFGVIAVVPEAPVAAAALGSQDAARTGTDPGDRVAGAAEDPRAIVGQVDDRLAGVDAEHQRRCETTQAFAARQPSVPVTRVPAGAPTPWAVASVQAWLDAPAPAPGRESAPAAEPVELRGTWSWGGAGSRVGAAVAAADGTWQTFRAELRGFTSAVATTTAPSRAGLQDPAWCGGSWQDDDAAAPVSAWARQWAHSSIDHMVGGSLAPTHTRLRDSVAPLEA